MQYWLWSVPPDALASFVRAETFALRTQGRRALQDVRPGDRIFAYIPGSQTLAALVEASGEAFEDDTALVLGRHLPHRIRVRVLTVLPQEAWVPYDGFVPHLSVLRQYADEPTPSRQFRRVVQRVLHPLPALDGKVLEFLVAARAGDDPEALMEMVEAVRETRQRPEPEPESTPEAVSEPLAAYAPWDRAAAMARLLAQIEARGFVYAPWEVAALVTALRTRPFALLAGVTGVGKSRLPQLIADATGARTDVLPVRPDWTDPSETIGYRGLDGRFRAGSVLRAARAAAETPDRFSMLVLDEMNLARPEHYLAEVLSRMEMRAPAASGGAETPPLVSEALSAEDAIWQAVRMGPTLGLVGTVNVDESAHAFSRKVLDRAFTLELHASDLATWTMAPEASGAETERWPVAAWWPRALRLAHLGPLAETERETVDAAVRAVTEADALLAPAGLGVGYRTRDEIALFCLHAAETPEAFCTRDGQPVDPLDLALLLRLLPRIEGAGAALQDAVLRLFAWASGDAPEAVGRAAASRLESWSRAGRPGVLPATRFPRMAARLARIAEGLVEDGVASYWA